MARRTNHASVAASGNSCLSAPALECKRLLDEYRLTACGDGNDLLWV